MAQCQWFTVALTLYFTFLINEKSIFSGSSELDVFPDRTYYTILVAELNSVDFKDKIHFLLSGMESDVTSFKKKCLEMSMSYFKPSNSSILSHKYLLQISVIAILRQFAQVCAVSKLSHLRCPSENQMFHRSEIEDTTTVFELSNASR